METPPKDSTPDEAVRWVKFLYPTLPNIWWLTPNAAFDGRTPMELVEANEVDELVKMVYFLESGVSS